MRDTVNGSVFSSRSSFRTSISTDLGPVSPGANVNSNSFGTKSASVAVEGVAAILKRCKSEKFMAVERVQTLEE